MNPRAASILQSKGVVKIAPSVLAADFGRLAEQVREAEAGGADQLHLDVMDGHFVPNLTMGPDIVKAIRRAVSLPLDCHLMITHPQDYLEKFITAGADVIYFHVEAEGDARETIKQIHGLDAAAGITLNPETPLTEAEPFLEAVDVVLIMTVRPGFGGQSFMGEQLVKAREVRDGWGLPVVVDGGVGVQNARTCFEHGAETLVAGTSVFRQESIAQAIEAIRLAAMG